MNLREIELKSNPDGKIADDQDVEVVDEWFANVPEAGREYTGAGGRFRGSYDINSSMWGGKFKQNPN